MSDLNPQRPRWSWQSYVCAAGVVAFTFAIAFCMICMYYENTELKGQIKQIDDGSLSQALKELNDKFKAQEQYTKELENKLRNVENTFQRIQYLFDFESFEEFLKAVGNAAINGTPYTRGK